MLSTSLFLGLAFFAQADTQQGLTDDLLVPATLPHAGLDSGLPFELERRIVRIQSAALAGSAAGGLSELDLELFDGEVVRVTRTERSAAPGGFIWRGTMPGHDHSEVLLSVVGQAVTGTIVRGHDLYRIAPAEVDSDIHYLAELDSHFNDECGVDASHQVFGDSLESQHGNGSRNPIIDVMVVYTTSARNGAGGTNGMNSLINLAVTETNDAYANSDANQRIALAHSYELPGYNENGNFSTELSRLRAKNDGHMDDVHTERDTYAADCVSMIVNGSQYCGIAYLMTNPSANFESNAFSVVARVCATGYYSFGHELGHNMGSTHDRANAGSGAYSYSYGWRTTNNAWRTVMAYSPGTRIKYFSNPNKTRSGFPLGKANTDENYRSLNNTAQICADWRDGGSSGTDLDLVVDPLVAGQLGTATVSGTGWTTDVYLYNGSGMGTTTLPGLGVDLEIANGKQVADDRGDPLGIAVMTKMLPASLAGRVVYLQAVDENGQLSQVVVDTIL